MQLLDNHAKFEGQWVAGTDVREGVGKQIWPDGSMYAGEYKNGMKQGKGKFIWADQSSYKGEFKENDLHGLGEYIWADGRVYNG